jgi:peptide chain release factor 2
MEALDGFWNDAHKVSKLQKEKSTLESVLAVYAELKILVEEFEILYDYSLQGDGESEQEARSIIEQISPKIEEAEKKALLSGEVDANNAIISINAGAGGTESCDWAQMIYRMIVRYSEKNGFKTALMDYQDGDSAGIKSATFTVDGPFAYGLLKAETGVHRLVRISPFDSNARRHTSFASVFVSPEVDDEIEIKIEPNDVKIDVYRSGGAGGQSVNTTDSAVRLTHLPTGIVVTCQNQRSQHQNKDQAFKVLKSRLFEKAMEEKRAIAREIESNKKEIGWGSQIRSYVLHPYKMVKDHRTKQESGSPDKVLDGDLSDFIQAFLEWQATGATRKELTPDE